MGDFKAVGGTTARIIRGGVKSSIRKLFVQSYLQLFVTRLRPQRIASFGSKATPLLVYPAVAQKSHETQCSQAFGPFFRSPVTHYKPGRGAVTGDHRKCPAMSQKCTKMSHYGIDALEYQRYNKWTV